MKIGRPILVGTRTIKNSEFLADKLESRGIHFRLLNGKQDLAEATIVARAGETRSSYHCHEHGRPGHRYSPASGSGRTWEGCTSLAWNGTNRGASTANLPAAPRAKAIRVPAVSMLPPTIP